MSIGEHQKITTDKYRDNYDEIFKHFYTSGQCSYCGGKTKTNCSEEHVDCLVLHQKLVCTKCGKEG